MKIKTINFEDLEFSYFGPDLFWGPMPTVFYFSIDAHSSLCVDPFNQAITPMVNHSMRVFSIDLPEHGNNLDPHTALSRWADHYVQHNQILEHFINKVSLFIDHLHKENLIDHRLGVMGLSRGAFIASHLASLNPKVQHIVGFAPLSVLKKAKEFEALPTSVSLPCPIADLKDKIFNRSIKFYIGNHDTRVGTLEAISAITEISAFANLQNIRQAPIEAVIYPSIGHMGHGTSPQIFEEGSIHMIKKLGFLNGF
jgi:esterase FrsA